MKWPGSHGSKLSPRMLYNWQKRKKILEMRMQEADSPSTYLCVDGIFTERASGDTRSSCQIDTGIMGNRAIKDGREC